MNQQLLPFSKLILYLILGILLQYFLGYSLSVLLCLTALGVIISLIFYYRYHFFNRSTRVTGFQLGLLLAFLGAGGLSLLKQSSNTASFNYSGSEIKAIATVIDVERSEERIVYHLDISEAYLSGASINDGFRVVGDASQFQDTVYPGDQIFVSGKLSNFFENLNPGAFNYKAYMNDNGYAYKLWISNMNILSRPRLSLKRIAFQARSSLSSVLIQYLQKRELGVTEALVLGQKRHLDQETKQAFAGVGAMHILAVSGLHVGLVFLLFNALLRPIKRLRKGDLIHTILLIVIILAYAGLTGFSPSVTRASLMFVLLSIGASFKRKANTYNIIFASAFLMLLYDSRLLFDIGFQLSYCAVLGIVYLYPRFFKLFHPNNWLGLKIWSLLCVSFAAQIATFPLSLYYFHQFPTYFLITNILVIPYAFVLLFGGFSLFAVHFSISNYLPEISKTFGWCYQQLAWLLNESIQYLFALPNSTITNIEINLFEAVLIYGLILFIALFLRFFHRVFLWSGLTIVIMLLSFVTYSKYSTLSSSGIQIFQSNKTAFSVFEGESVIFYTADTSAYTRKYQKSMIRDFDRVTGRHFKFIFSSRNIPKNIDGIIQINSKENRVSVNDKHLVLYTDVKIDSAIYRQTPYHTLIK